MKILRLLLLCFMTFIVWLFISQYFFCPRYSFRDSKPFSGNQLFNPYSAIDSGEWIKCNFHAHTNAWKGFTNGGDKAADVWKVYDSLGYTINCVSDYHQINHYLSQRENYIPVYEHGYNLKKVHQLILGGHRVEWLDYVFPQTRSNKQRVLSKLSADKQAIIILAHPAIRNGYTIADMKYLGGYNCIEASSPAINSFPWWDAALSSGKPVFIAGNDDIHNVFKTRRIGSNCTWLNVTRVNEENVLTALREGRGYAMKIAEVNDEDPDHRSGRHVSGLPYLKSFQVNADTITLSLSDKAAEIEFTGQEGKVVASVSGTDRASYYVRPQDSYIRTTIRFSTGTEIYLNPVFRYSDNPLTGNSGFFVNVQKTNLYLVMGWVLLLIWSLILVRTLFNIRIPGRRHKGRQFPLPGLFPYPAAQSNFSVFGKKRNRLR